MVDSFLVENCKPISEPLELKADADVHRAARPNVQVISRRIREDVGAIYEKVLPKEVFEHIAVMTNQNMQEKLNRAEISHKIWKKYYQLVTAEEIVQMFALLQYFRLEGGPAKLDDWFKRSPPQWVSQMAHDQRKTHCHHQFPFL